MLLIIWVALFTTLSQGQSAEDIVLKTETQLRSYHSLQAEFVQIYFPSTVSTPLQEQGKLYLKKPGWMKWEYEDPEKKTFLLKDSLYQAYYPEDNQLIQNTIAEEEKEADIFSLLMGRQRLLEYYSVEFSPFPTDNLPVYQLKLTPQEEEEDTFILLEIHPKTWLIQRAIFFDWADNKQEFRFSHIQTDIALADDIFELKVPTDVEIIK